MSQVAKGPNKRAMVGLYHTESAAEAAQRRVCTNYCHDRLARHVERGTRLRETGETGLEARARIGALNSTRATEEIEKLALDDDGISLRWAIPRQIPAGPHAGKWCIAVPANEARTFQRDPRSGEITDRPSPEWAGAEIVEMDPAWWPEQDASA